ncbi:Geranylgeranyl transferase type-1 subunit beta [Morella rubra]|uniref:Geranylgeranyl transferase type-1 subunit beta n=1 Tax=Morella rubra TaxID=262757 RepID=A0A6A1VY89_9ROSI|nr:Geranylgeranyl transferase type-1 subunit beta [Morella rubra]
MESEWDPLDEPPSPPSFSSVFERDRHVSYLQMMYQLLPSPYQNQDINRLTLAYFVISGLRLLCALDCVDKDAVASWVLSLQAHPRNKAELNDGQFYGFHGSRSSQFPPRSSGVSNHNGSHLASTYCALAILKIVGYDFSNIDSETILTSMRNLQLPDGSFIPIHIGAETDLRFVYCAGKEIGMLGKFCIAVQISVLVDEIPKFLLVVSAAICFMLEDWRGMDKEKAKEYIINCQSYDGGFGLIPGSESHGSFSAAGGATYCAVASLRLMGFIGADLLSNSSTLSIINVPLLLNWILQVYSPHLIMEIHEGVAFKFEQLNKWTNIKRQATDGGFQGRPNKDSDTCYAFWIGAVLRILGGHKFIDENALRGFLLTCQSELYHLCPYAQGMGILWAVDGSHASYMEKGNKLPLMVTESSLPCLIVPCETALAIYWVNCLLYGLLISVQPMELDGTSDSGMYGGFSKFPGQVPDLYHSYYGFTAFSLLGESGMSSLCAELGIATLAATGL